MRGLFPRCNAFLLLGLLACTQAAASATYYVDSANSEACPCLTPAQPDASCGQSQTHAYSCIGDAINSAAYGDIISVATGTYAGKDCGLHVNKSGITLFAQAGGATIQCTTSGSNVIEWTASNVLLDGFTIRGYSGFPGTGINLYTPRGGGANTISNCHVSDAATGISVSAGQGDILYGGSISNCQTGIYLSCSYRGSPPRCVETPGAMTIRNLDIHDISPGQGISVDAVDGLTIDSVHVHHSLGFNGILVGAGGNDYTIQYSEIDNIAGPNSHGLYLGGHKGLVRGNRIHHNQAYGLHLWSAPQGSTSNERYRVEQNDIYANGKGMVLGGSNYCSAPRDPVCESQHADSFPRHVEISHNLIHHNIGHGFLYYVPYCDAPDLDNLFHHNTVFMNGSPQLELGNAQGVKILVKNNIIVGSVRPRSHVLESLIRALTTNLDPDAMDGNLLYAPDAAEGADTRLILWNPDDGDDNCNAGRCISINELRTLGAPKSRTCPVPEDKGPDGIIETQHSAP